MPMRPKRHVPGRPATALKHEQTPWRKADKAFYDSARWKRFRLWYLAGSPLCRDCDAKNKTTVATELHHIQKRKDRPDLDLEPKNILPLCTKCHSHRTAAGE